MPTFGWIFQESSDPELVQGVFAVQTGIPFLCIHVRDRCRSYNNLLSWDNPVLYINVHPIRHSNNIKMHSKA